MALGKSTEKKKIILEGKAPAQVPSPPPPPPEEQGSKDHIDEVNRMNEMYDLGLRMGLKTQKKDDRIKRLWEAVKEAVGACEEIQKHQDFADGFFKDTTTFRLLSGNIHASYRLMCDLKYKDSLK